MSINRALIYVQTPHGVPEAGKDLQLVEQEPFDWEAPAPAGGLTAQVLYVAYDPTMRLHMMAPKESKVFAPYEYGKPITNRIIAKVINRGDEARHPFQPGDLVSGYQPIQEYLVLDAGGAERLSLTPSNPYGLDPRLFLGPLGPPGNVGYASFYKLCEPQNGDVMLVSGASGAVGQTVGQLAKREGMTVFAVVGSKEKAEELCNNLGFDGAVNYKQGNLVEQIRRLAPNGINVYYDNIGGEVLEAAIETMANNGRIVACGFASQYNKDFTQQYGIRNTGLIIAKNIRWEGFSTVPGCWVFDYTKEHQKNLQVWIHEGSFKPVMTVTYGFDQAIDGLVAMFRGQHMGKAVLDLTRASTEQ
ncbi:Nad-binding protein [Pleurostoma richardsiae]|uniref:Dehydrogenase FUB6 n=1 Tax=Pleurostoma richardsiae TaxID=41990 RepID=A0AA38VB61_9PEZI|nr:Nad-binding protein [Pleurostoma richardsiae]